MDMDVKISERAQRVQAQIDHYGVVLPFNLALAVQLELDGAVEDAHKAWLAREGGRIKTPEELEAMYGADEAGRREQIIADSLAENRFVLFLERYGGPSAVSFSPRYDEAEQFLGWYVVPFLLGSLGVFGHTAWRSDKVSTEYVRWRDIRSIRFFTATPEQQAGLEKQARDLAEAANLKEREREREQADYFRKVNRHLDKEHGDA